MQEVNYVGQLVLLLSGFNGLFMRIHSLCAERGKGDCLDDAFETFLRFYGYGPVLSQAQPAADGCLDVDRVFRNLDTLAELERVGSLQSALTELFDFKLFAARAVLERSEVNTLRGRARAILEQLTAGVRSTP